MDCKSPKTAQIIGITGGIGSGKSVVSRVLRLNGYKVYDCDLEARRIMEEDPIVRQRLTKRWGDSLYHPEHGLDRKEVARRIFGDEGERLWLNELVHSLVRNDLAKWVELNVEERILFVESAILFSSGISGMCDSILVVTAPLDLRIKRLAERSGLTEEEALSRITSQGQEEVYLHETNLPVIVINNDGKESILGQLKANTIAEFSA